MELLMKAEDLDTDILFWEIDLLTDADWDDFFLQPEAFLVAKMRASEVGYDKLTVADKSLFNEAMSRELGQYLQQEAGRSCQDKAEEHEAWKSGRVMKACWVLTWKPIDADDTQSAMHKRQTEGIHTTIHPTHSKKAKARIVILGFQHPELGSPNLRTARPVVSQHAKHVFYQTAAWHNWTLMAADASSAFLQSDNTEEKNRVWTTGVGELAVALGVEPGSALRILKACYGLTTAPRIFWQDAKTKLEHESFGTKPILGDQCLWRGMIPTPMATWR
jgi:hypothetical protein